jgi:hypothetical protein
MIMRKLLIFGLMLVAVCALSASFVASASAEAPGKFLVNGAVPIVAVEAITEGELLFESLKTGSAAFLCSSIWDGTITAGGELYEVTKILVLSGMEVPASDANAKLTCTPDPGSICSKSAVSPANLPWNYGVDLVTESDFLTLTLANINGLFPAYFLSCEVLGVVVTELCELLLETQLLVENGPTDVVSPAGSSSTPDAHCSGDSASEESGGLVVDEGLLFVPGATLAISE